MGPFVHDIDHILATVGGVHLWWYGLGFSLGFLQIHRFIRSQRDSLRLDLRQVYACTLCVVIGVLVGGRLVEVSFDEWPFYRQHVWLVPAYWLGGMATHGLLLGAAAGAVTFSAVWRRPFLELADALVVPGAFLMGVGRLGNFIDGQIVGSVTDVWWAVKFPDAEGYRHPVVLYDGLKNLALVPYLRHVRAKNPTPGAAAARFVFWYAFLRIFIDLFRDYPTHRLALGMWWQRALFAAILLFCLTIPGNWTQDVPDRYGKRHPGLRHSWIYPDIDTSPAPRTRH
jgi:phosphatidylglycerol:prolipoprotein diacylglycerol transferase